MKKGENGMVTKRRGTSNNPAIQSSMTAPGDSPFRGVTKNRQKSKCIKPNQTESKYIKPNQPQGANTRSVAPARLVEVERRRIRITRFKFTVTNWQRPEKNVLLKSSPPILSRA
ncbi:MAG TPA: hypothetical protein VHC44_13540 [Verrucomicrobiae bacterium]|nr:hypothetical protein [Verrucomicrobiae bacterium]